MNKTYGRINWENYPSDETPLNESNLNKIDVATDEIDNRVITLDTTKATKEEVSTLVQDVTFEEKTGIITIVKKNGSKVTIDTQMEKIAVNFSYNAGTQQIILTLIDGTKQYIDLSALITQYEFLDSDTVAFSIDSAGKVSAIVKEASIQEKHLQPNYLADIKVEVAKAQASQSAATKSESNAKASETAAATSESNAAASATKAQSYAVGGTNSRTGEDTDNAKYYSQQSAQSQSAAATSADTASTKAEEAAASAATAKTSADNAAGSANLANEKANSAANSATTAVSNSNAAQQYASNAAASADTAQNYAVADTDSAKYYYEQARRISESFSGALRPMGTVTFANLPALSEADGGSMYNISDQFVTTSDFKEGAGNTIPAGANVYKTEDGKWDVLAGTPVTGVKGSAESSYRTGNVNITPANIGAVSKDEFDGLEIGGRNLALDTSSQYSTPFTSFNGYENQTPSVAKVLTDGLKEGDIITVSIVFKYNNIVPTSGHSARFSLLQGYGNVNGYNGGFPAGKILEGISGDDEIEIVYQSKLSKQQLENNYWVVGIRCDWIQSGSMQWKQLKIEKGNKPTDWTPAPEDIDSSISALEGTTTTLSKQYTSLNQTLSSLTATVNANTTAITKKADGSTVTMLKNNLTSLEANLNGFKSEVSSTYTTKTDFNNLEIGGRNLYTGTKDFTTEWPNIINWETDGTYKGFTVKKRSGQLWQALWQSVNVQEGEVYTYSAYAKTDNLDNFSIGYFMSGASCGAETLETICPTEVNAWTRVSATCRITKAGTMHFGIEPKAAGTIWVCGLKLEQGNRPTDWTPAPEDLESALSIRDYNDTSKKIKVGWVGNSLSQDQILSVACYASGDDDIVKAKIKDVTKATFKNWLGEVSPSDGSGYYVKNENLSNIDLNDVTTTGIYHLTGTLTNNPINGNATLYVDFNVGTPYQLFIPDYNYRLYKRVKSNGNWSSWTSLFTWNNLEGKPVAREIGIGTASNFGDFYIDNQSSEGNTLKILNTMYLHEYCMFGGIQMSHYKIIVWADLPHIDSSGHCEFYIGKGKKIIKPRTSETELPSTTVNVSPLFDLQVMYGDNDKRNELDWFNEDDGKIILIGINGTYCFYIDCWAQ